MHPSIPQPTDEVLDVIAHWHRYLSGEAPDALDDLLDDDAVMVSPVVFTPQRGKAIVAMYLEAAKATFASGGYDVPDGFRYTRQIASGDTAVLEFETTMGGKYVNGVDMIQVRSGRITEFRVMIRPLQAVHTVHELMRAQLAARHKPD
jgi:ketosteroid isomerase-like protein